MAGNGNVDELEQIMPTEESNTLSSLPSQNDDDIETQDQPSTVSDQQDKLVQLPLSRIKNIIKTDPDVKMTSQEAVIVLAKAAELFIHQLVTDTTVKTLGERKKTLTKQHLDHIFFSKDCYSFLEGVLESYEA